MNDQTVSNEISSPVSDDISLPGVEYGSADDETFMGHIEFLLKINDIDFLPLKIFIGTDIEKNKAFQDFSSSVRKYYLVIHQDKINAKEVSEQEREKQIELFQSYGNAKEAIQYLYDHGSDYANDKYFIEAVTSLCNRLGKNEKTTTNQKSQSINDKRKREDDTKKLKDVEASKFTVRCNIESIIKELFISGRVNEKTPFEGPVPTCSLSNRTHESDFLTILPCCNKLVNEIVLADSLYNELTNNDSPEKLFEIYQNRSYKIKLNCPLCNNEWFRDLIDINDYSCSSLLLDARNTWYFNNVFFLMKNQRRADRIGFETEKRRYLLEIDNLRDQISCLATTIETFQQDKYKALQSPSFEMTDNEVSIIQTDSSSKDSNYNETYYDDSYMANTSTENENDESFIDDVENDDINLNLPTSPQKVVELDIGEDRSIEIAARLILKEIKSVKHTLKSYLPKYLYQSKSDNCKTIACPYYPRCKQIYQYTDKIQAGKKLQKFRRHYCTPINSDLKLTIKHDEDGNLKVC